MGVVYEAFDQERETPVALKTLHGLSADAIWILKREFRALAGVSHPALVQLYELFSEGGHWFFTMELVRGADLVEALRGPQLDEARIRRAFLQLAAGVHALHGAGRLHRDLKPSNVLLADGEPERVVILDFGLARDEARNRLYRSTEAGLVGTPAYMAPEQAFGEGARAASDWYAVGLVLYEVLTGHRPFDGETIRDVLMARHQHDGPSPADRVEGLPEGLVSLCSDLLRRDPERRPVGDAVVQRLRDGDQALPPMVTTGARPPAGARIVGRSDELHALRVALDAVCDGQPRVIRLHGRPGAGTSALASRFLEDAVWADPSLVALEGRCRERELVPFRALDGVIDALCRVLRGLPEADVAGVLPRDVGPLVRLFPVLDRVPAVSAAPRRTPVAADPGRVRRRAFDALRELLGRLGDRRTVILAIDGLQWADPDGVALLEHLLRGPDAPVFLLLACYRSDEVETSAGLADLLAWIDRSVGSAEVVAGPLCAEDAVALAADMLAPIEASQAVLEAVARESGGNPGLVRDLVGYLAANPEIAASEEDVANVGLAHALDRRLEALEEPARRMLEVLAVAGRPVLPALALRAAEVGARAQGALDALRSHGLVRSSGDGQVLLAHSALREPLLERQAPDVLRGRHLDMARALEGAPNVDPEVIAVHLLHADRAQDAAAHLVAAAERASAGLAFLRAADLYRRAIVLDPEAEGLRSLRVALGETLEACGHGPEAARAFLSAISGASEEEALELRRRAAQQLLCAGHVDRGLEVLEEVLSALGLKLAPTPGRALISLAWRRLRLRLRGLGFDPVRQASGDALRRVDASWTVAVGLGVVDTIRAADVQSLHLLLALDAGEPSRVCRALASEAGFVSVLGASAVGRTEKLLDAARRLCAEHEDRWQEAWIGLMRGIAAYMGGRWQDARSGLEAAEALMVEHCRGVAWELDSARLTTLWSLAWLGDLPALCSRVPEIVRDATDRGDRYASTSARTGWPNAVWLVADEPDRARAELEEAIAGWSRRGFHAQHYWDLLAEAHLDLYAGDPQGACQRIDARWRALSRSGLLRVQTVRAEVTHLRARSALLAHAAGTGPTHLKVAERSAAALLREHTPWTVALAHLVGAAVHAARGRTPEAAEGFATAATACREAGMALYATCADRARGALEGGQAGAERVAAADRALTDAGVVAPARLARMLVPS